MSQPRIHIVLCPSTAGYTEPTCLFKGMINYNLNRITNWLNLAHRFRAALLARGDASPPGLAANIWQCQAAILPENARTVLSSVRTRLPCCQQPAREPERAPSGEHTRVSTIPTDEDSCIIKISSNNQRYFTAVHRNKFL